MRVVAVAKRDAERLRRDLHAKGLVDRSVRITHRGDRVLIPVTTDEGIDLAPFAATFDDTAELPPRETPHAPQADIADRLRAAGVPTDLAPRRWERIGDVLVIRISRAAQPAARAIARVFGEVLKVRTVVEDRSGIHGPMRTPDVRVLWGNGTETIHREGGVRYALDVARIMFASGNLSERVGIPSRIRSNDVVVDLFAGIGYFALPIALRSSAREIYACEVNPIAFRYLTRNIRLNRATNVIPLFGNCREVAPRNAADCVLMGHFDARDYLDVAFETLRARGTIVYHELCPKEQVPEEPIHRVSEAARANWMHVNGVHHRIVKSYAPGIVHVVVEARVAPQTRKSKHARPPKGISRETYSATR